MAFLFLEEAKVIHVQIDTRRLIRSLDQAGRKQLPFATMQALNRTAFELRGAWGDEMRRVFDRPTSLTLNAVLYRKATRTVLMAEVFLRDEATKGTPPAKYLRPNVIGGARSARPHEKLLRLAGVLGPSEYVAPGRGVQLDAAGNVPAKVISAVLSDLTASRDPQRNSTRQSRGKRARRKKARGGVYFYNRARRGNLPRGIYERIGTGFGSAVRSVLCPVSSVSYQQSYDVLRIADRLFAERFPQVLDQELRRALASARR